MNAALLALAMTRDPLITQRRRTLVFVVLAVGILTSALVAIALFYLSQARPRS